MEQLQRLREIKEAILLSHPECAPILLPVDFKETKLPPGALMGTDGVHILYQDNICEKQDDPHLAAKVIHEDIHIMLSHATEARMCPLTGPVPLSASDPDVEEFVRLKARYGHAVDYVTNCIVNALGLPVDDGLYDPQYEGLSVEEVFNRLPQNVTGKAPDYHIFVPGAGDGQESKEQQLQKRQAFADFLTLAKAAGTLPGSMVDQLADLFKPEIPWLDLLQDWITVQCGSEDTTWKRPSRRGLAVDLYLPSGIDQSLQCLGYGRDTSGSMTDEDCAKGIGAATAAAEAVKIKKFVLVDGDAAVQRVLIFEAGDFVPPMDIPGRGGTDFRPIFEELLKHDPVCVVYFTDLEGTFPEKRPPIPVIWVTRNQQGEVPWGKVVRIK